MAEPPWTPPAQPRHHTGLVVALVVCLLAVVGGGGLSGYLLYHAARQNDPAWPSGWHTASFIVDDTDAVQVDAGRLLTYLAGDAARYAVHDRHVVVAVPAAHAAALARLRSLLPIRTELSLRPVLRTSTPPSPDCLPGGAPVCDRDGVRYRLGPSVLSGGQVTGVRVHSDRTHGWSLTVEFTAAGQRALTAATGRHDQLAVVMAGAVLTAPRVAGPVSGALQLSGAMTGGQVRRLAAAFRLGRHPVTISRPER